MTTLLEILQRTERWFRDKGLPTPRLDAELLLAHVLGMERLQLYLKYDRPMTQPELDTLRDLVKRRATREPLAWITGHKGFHRLDLVVVKDVLVPRPDTETLVEAALEWIGEPDQPTFVADVGTGTGAVGLSLAHARPTLRVYATDVSEAALACAKDNVARLGLTDRVAVLRGPLLTPIPTARPIDWVVSNPPYIPSAVIDTLQPEVSRFEPRLALDGGRDGLEVVRALVTAARARARLGLLLEIGHDQAARTREILEDAAFVDVTTWKDHGGHERVVGGRLPGA